jgi:DNA ligase-1
MFLIASCDRRTCLRCPAALARPARVPHRCTRGPRRPGAAAGAGRYRPGMPLRDYWVSEKYDGVRGLLGRPSAAHARRRGDATPRPGSPPAGPRRRWTASCGPGAAALSRPSPPWRQQPDDAQWRADALHGVRPAHPPRQLRRTPGRPARRWWPPGPALGAGRAAASVATMPPCRPCCAHRARRRRGADAAPRRLALPRGPQRRSAQAQGRTRTPRRACSPTCPARANTPGRLGALLVETPDGPALPAGLGFQRCRPRHPPPVGSWVTYRFRGTARQRAAALCQLRAGAPLVVKTGRH